MITLYSTVLLIATLPIIIYAYSILTIVTKRITSYERSDVLLDLETLEQRLQKTFRLHSVQCNDYAQWDEAYKQTIERNPSWIKSNIIEGIAAPAFGYKIVLMQAANGDTIYQKGLTEPIARDLTRYKLLELCLKGRTPNGFALLGNKLYICAAGPIVRNDNSGKPRGMFLVAKLVDNKLLEELAPGSKHRLAVYTTNGQLIAHQALGPMDRIPKPLARALYTSRIPHHRQVPTSTNSLLSYGVLPIKDISGRLAAAFIDVKPRAQPTENLRIIRRTAILLMLICGLVALTSVGYVRNKTMALQAYRDVLTGLYNHRYLQEYLKNQVQLAERYGRPLSIIMLDLDHFKFINDAYGHSVGDIALKTLAQALTETVRVTDTVARYGGEEFVVVCPETDPTQASAAAERMRRVIEGTAIHFKAGKTK
ncbi:MAG: sensor domain-containing diguanylate cyclase, partial [Armatimonadota bacterium]